MQFCVTGHGKVVSTTVNSRPTTRVATALKPVLKIAPYHGNVALASVIAILRVYAVFMSDILLSA